MENQKCDFQRILNQDAYSELEEEIFELRRHALRLKLLDQYRDNTGSDLATSSISFDIDELFSLADDISMLFYQLMTGTANDSHNTPLTDIY